MGVNEQDMKARRFDFEEKRRNLRDLNDLRKHIEASLARLAAAPANGSGGQPVEQRRQTLQDSMSDIDRRIELTETELREAGEALEREEAARFGYDRVPVAIGSRRGRAQVEHVRIVRSQRG